jgi:mitogen-activated protein kinase 1/3
MIQSCLFHYPRRKVKQIKDLAGCLIASQSIRHQYLNQLGQYSAMNTRSLKTISEYEFLKELGEGAYGVVNKAIHKKTGKTVAIKTIEFDSDLSQHDKYSYFKRLLREIKLLRLLKGSPNLISLNDVIQSRSSAQKLYLVFDYMEMSLTSALNKTNDLSNTHIQFIFYQIIRALHSLHAAQIIHRDIKSCNILIDEHCNVKICDLGFARGLKNEETKDSATSSASAAASESAPLGHKRSLTAHVVSRWYRAPEIILKQHEYTSAVDMWSAGCIFAELLKKLPENPHSHKQQALFPGKYCLPFSPKETNCHASHTQLNFILSFYGTWNAEDTQWIEDKNYRNALMNFKNESPPNLSKLFPGASAEAIDLLKRLLAFDPAKRITAKEVLNHPYMQSCAKYFQNRILMPDAAEMQDYDRIENEFENNDSTHITADLVNQVWQRIETEVNREEKCHDTQHTSSSSSSTAKTMQDLAANAPASAASIEKNITQPPVAAAGSVSMANLIAKSSPVAHAQPDESKEKKTEADLDKLSRPLTQI